MITKTIIDSLQNKDWSSFILELVIIFIGIFAALQVDSWYQDELEERRVSVQLDRIEEDAQFLETQLHDLLVTYNRKMYSFKVALDVLDGEPLNEENREHFEYALTSATLILNPNQPLSGLSQLIDSGDINIVDNEELRDELLDFAYATNRQEFIDTHMRELLNVNVRDYLRGFSWDIPRIDTDLTRGAEFELKYDLDELRNNYPFRDALGDLARLQSVWRRATVTDIDELGELIALLGQR